MKKLKIGVIDLVAKGPTNTLWAKIMYANLASIMPQVVATWCEEEGHEVTMICYTGQEDLSKELPQEADLIFISSFTHAALLAYSLSNYFQSKGAVTVLGIIIPAHHSNLIRPNGRFKLISTIIKSGYE